MCPNRRPGAARVWVVSPSTVMVLLLLALTAACTAGSEPLSSGGADAVGTSKGTSQRVGAEHNETDVAYAHEVSALHRQAVDMVAMLGNKEVSVPVRDLAAVIGRARTAELDELDELLRSWRIPPHGVDFHGNPGELTIGEMSDLYALEGEEFEQQWLVRMVANHRGAVAMSRAEVDHGLNVTARDLARRLAQIQHQHAQALERSVR